MIWISARDGEDAVIDLSNHGGGSIRLENITATDLSAADFQFEIRGTDENDSIRGGDNKDSLYGLEGDDFISGGAGNDTLFGNAGEDRIFGGEGNDIIDGGVDADVIRGGEGKDTIFGGTGNDFIAGGKGDDTLTGGEGADIFIYEDTDGEDGVSNDDTITDFTINQDILFLHKLPGVLGFDDLDISQDGEDAVIDLSDHGGGSIRLENITAADLSAADFQFEINGTDENDSIRGGDYNDTLSGERGGDDIDGGAGDDFIVGGAGEDTLTGGAGDDTLIGGEGADTFVFAAGHGTDTIRDFTDGEDTIDLSAITGITDFENLTITAEGNATVIDLTAHGGSTIRLENFDSDNLDAEDFIFSEAPTDDGGTDGI